MCWKKLLGRIRRRTSGFHSKFKGDLPLMLLIVWRLVARKWCGHFWRNKLLIIIWDSHMPCFYHSFLSSCLQYGIKKTSTFSCCESVQHWSIWLQVKPQKPELGKWLHHENTSAFWWQRWRWITMSDKASDWLTNEHSMPCVASFFCRHVWRQKADVISCSNCLLNYGI